MRRRVLVSSRVAIVKWRSVSSLSQFRTFSRAFFAIVSGGEISSNNRKQLLAASDRLPTCFPMRANIRNPACRLRTTIFEEDKIRLNRFLGAALLTIAASAISQTAAAQLVLDDFSTGAYKKQLASGSDINVQSGSMIGGHRETAFLVCPPGPCGLTNQFGQTGSIQIRPATKLAPSALIYSAGFEVFPRVDVVYGSAAPLNLALAP